MGTMIFMAVAAFADDPEPGTFVDPGNPAPAPAASSSGAPTANDIRGHWFMTSQVDGKEAVAWACKGHPTMFDLDDETVMITIGTEPLGGAVRSTSTRGAALVLTTTLESCGGAKEMAISWADASHRILKIDRCEGTPRSVRAVRDQASGVPVMRQCCDATGKAVKFVGIDDACPSGAEGQKPTPLKR